MIELSILLLTYNSDKYIEETILSILKQNVDFKYEIIVGDDCSTDNTFEILKNYKNKYPDLIKLTQNESQLGILKNFKSTLDRCSGDYIFDLAGDDLFADDFALKTLVDTLKNDPTLGFVDSGYNILNDKKGKKEYFSNKALIESPKNVYKEKILLGSSSTIGICFNRTLLYKYVDFDSYILMGVTIDDYPILVDLIMNTKFTTVNKPLQLYRVHNHSYSHKKDFDKQYFLSNQMKMLFDYFTKKYDFENNIIENYNKLYLKQILYYAGYYQKKQLGREIFLKLKSKDLKDYIHYWCSQSKLFRMFASVI